MDANTMKWLRDTFGQDLPISAEGVKWEDLQVRLDTRADATDMERLIWNTYNGGEWVLFPEWALDQAWKDLGVDVCTIVGYARLHGQRVTGLQAYRLGQIATNTCRRLGLPIDRVPHARFGRVNAYPKWLLSKHWREWCRGVIPVRMPASMYSQEPQ
jgi:hypothetical protein